MSGVERHRSVQIALPSSNAARWAPRWLRRGDLGFCGESLALATRMPGDWRRCVVPESGVGYARAIATSVAGWSPSAEQPVGNRVARMDRHERAPQPLLTSDLVVGPLVKIAPREHCEDDLNKHENRR
jgi:hypothetical protein